MSSYIAPPFTTRPFDPNRLEGLLSFSDQQDPLQRTEAFLSTDQEVKRQALSGLSNDALENNATNFIPEALRSRLQKLAAHQADLAYQLTFILEAEQAPNSNSTLSNRLSRSLSTKSDLLPFLPNDQSRRFTLPHAPLVSVGMKNKVVSKVPARRMEQTTAAGASLGSIKERWSLDDLEVSISGIFLLQNTRSYPLREVQSLYLILKKRASRG